METTQHRTLLILTSEITPRATYIFDFLFRKILGVDYAFTIRHEEFLQSELPKLNYSNAGLSDELFLKAHPLLFEKEIHEQKIDEIDFKGCHLFFATSPDSFLPFDPFACSFYLISRYEEYHSEVTDEHERFEDSESLLARLNMHHLPVVDQMAYWIAEKLQTHFPSFSIQNRNFKFISTIDIDNAWAFKNKSIVVSAGAIGKAIFSGQWAELKQRLVVFLGLQTDPYDTYSFILSAYQGLTDHLKFFFLIGDRNRFDRNISHKNQSFRQLISNLSSVCEVGIHPSYESNHKPWLFQMEKERLENILKKPVTQSRQHYLKLRFPRTYHNLLKSGITDDFTMGYARMVGFRAGTCTPFPFFDLTENKCTELIIHPFQVMDVTLKNYLHLNPEKAWQLISELMLAVKEVNGTFISLWHNESLKDSGQWQGWRTLFEKILETGKTYENE